jgi:hypothetical protein
MNFNDIRQAEREGKLSDYDLPALRDMSRTCAHWLQSENNQIHTHTKDSVDKEIHRKEMAEAQKRADETSRQMHGEAMTESRRSTHYARWSFRVAILASAISLGAWIFPRVFPVSHPPDAARLPASAPHSPPRCHL